MRRKYTLNEFAKAVTVLKDLGFKFTQEQSLWVLNKTQKLADGSADSDLINETLGEG